MSKLVTIYGGSGFVGRYIARRMAQDGWRVRVAVRHPNESMFVRTYGSVGQVEPVLCNVRDDASVLAAMQGADAVVNCVGVLSERGKNSFGAVQHLAAERIARTAAVCGISNFVHLSAIGADKDAQSAYSASKGLGEEAVLEHVPNAMILRPSVIFGADDAFFDRFASMSRMGPVLPIAGANTLFQPVYVDDVARAAVMGIKGEAQGLYELGGPDVSSLRDLMVQMLGVIHRRKLIVNLPFIAARLVAFGFDVLQAVTFGLFHNGVLTGDQIKALRVDCVVGDDALGFASLGMQPTAMAAVLPDYLWRFRPSGQYDAIKDSASNLRT